MTDTSDIIAQLNAKIAQAILAQNVSALLEQLVEFTKAHRAFAIYEFHLIIKQGVLQYTNSSLSQQGGLAPEKEQILNWLEATLKHDPHQSSMMLIRSDIARQQEKLDDANQLFRQALTLYLDFLQKDSLPLSSYDAWHSMLKAVLLSEAAQDKAKGTEKEAYPLILLQLESFFAKAIDNIKKMEQFYSTIARAILTHNTSALQQQLVQLTQLHQTFAIYEFHYIIKEIVLQQKAGDFLVQKPIAREKMATLRWLEVICKNNPYELSIMLVRGNIALYNNQLNKASKIFRQSLMLYINLLQKNNLPITSYDAWDTMLKYALFIEPAEAEGTPYNFEPLQLPDSLINKAPQTIITAYGNVPYVKRCAERLTDNITQLMPDVEILLVVGDTDAETEKEMTALQQKYPRLHIAYDMTPDMFQATYLRPCYYACRRFTYLQDIISQSNCGQLVTIDIDLFIHPVFKTCVDYMTDAPVGYRCDVDVIFAPDNLIVAGYMKVDNSDIGQKFSRKLCDYISKKLASKHAIWFVDQYALCHAWQAALTTEEQQECRNINDCHIGEYHMDHLHFGFSQDEKTIQAEELKEKRTDLRLKNIIMPQHVRFDEQTLCPILNLDGDK